EKADRIAPAVSYVRVRALPRRLGNHRGRSDAASKTAPPSSPACSTAARAAFPSFACGRLSAGGRCCRKQQEGTESQQGGRSMRRIALASLLLSAGLCQAQYPYQAYQYPTYPYYPAYQYAAYQYPAYQYPAFQYPAYQYPAYQYPIPAYQSPVYQSP